MNKLSPRTVKWLTKMINHKRWGRYRYSKGSTGWLVQKLVCMDWHWCENYYSDNGVEYGWGTERRCTEIITKKRADAINKFCKNRRKSKQYKKRKWTYLP